MSIHTAGACLGTTLLVLFISSLVESPNAASSVATPGEAAASAVNEVFAQRSDQAGRAIVWKDRPRPPEINDRHTTDPYPAWLATTLLSDAANGTLFEEGPDGMTLHLRWSTGDDRFWYIGRVSRAAGPTHTDVVADAWVMWPKLGALTEPLEGKNPWDDHVQLRNVKVGDIVILDVFRISRAAAMWEKEVNAAAVADRPDALMLRLPLPVVRPVN